MFENIFYYISHNYWYDFADSRTKHLLLINQQTPWLILWLMVNYLLFAKIAGPAFMRKQRAYELRLPMIAYNITMALTNGGFFIGAVMRCQFGRRFLDFRYPDIRDMSVNTVWEIHGGYLYWITKLMDLTDTVFFVLRKKHTQISFLHLYHHTVVPLFGWLFMNLNPLCPPAIFFVLINSFIHVVMYSYYSLSAMGPNVQKYLWWKKYITVMQLWQFVIFGAYGFVMFFFQTGYPVFWLYIGLTQPPVFFWLFHNFYRHSYKTTRSTIDFNKYVKLN